MNNQQILAQQGLHIDDPVVISAIENKAIIVILQGQSVNASNGTEVKVNGVDGFVTKCLESGKTRKEIIEQLDRILITQALEKTQYNYLQAARLLNISNNNIHEKAKRLGLK